MRRRSYLAEFEVLLVLALVGCGVAALAGVWRLIAREPLTVTLEAAPTLSGLTSGVHPAGEGPVSVVVEEPSWSQIGWEVARTAPRLALVIVTLVLLLLVVRTARRGDPFALVNVRRLAAAGWGLVGGSAVVFALDLVAVTALAASVTTDGLGVSVDYPIFWLFCSLGFLAVAEVLKRGRALQAELAEVI